jgi:hypothetical protein
MKKTYHGSCTCSSVRFEADLDLSAGTMRCNCGMCKKARFWFQFAHEGDFRLLQGREVLVDFQRTTAARPEPFLHFWFCGKCGVRAFSEGPKSEALGPAFHAVNLGCLDDATDEELSAAPIHYVDGRHDQFDRAPAITRYL